MAPAPDGAWGAELSGNYHERTRINSARQRWVLLGLIGATFVPAGAEILLGDCRHARRWFLRTRTAG
ncbi:MAG: hypothetical protein U5R48_19660 [Gammaproteobacteria bacterium]|nr:hypothetical protein [Gammaproteobacteria bacterium]